MHLRTSALMTFSIMLSIGLMACVTSRMEEINVEPNTRSVVGWLDARGELTVFPVRSIAHYDPFTKIDAQRCVTIVVEPTFDRSNVSTLQGHRVEVQGRVVVYDDLPIMGGPLGTYLHKREFMGEAVENPCLRDYVFLANTIREAPQ